MKRHVIFSLQHIIIMCLSPYVLSSKDYYVSDLMKIMLIDIKVGYFQPLSIFIFITVNQMYFEKPNSDKFSYHLVTTRKCKILKSGHWLIRCWCYWLSQSKTCSKRTIINQKIILSSKYYLVSFLNTWFLDTRMPHSGLFGSNRLA